jgi:transposase
MAQYGKGFKERAVARLLPPESSPVETVSREMGVGVATLERWRANALSLPESKQIWTAAARLEAVIATAAMDAEAKSAWCREKGLYLSELETWRQGATAAPAEPKEARASPQQTRQAKKRI